MEMPGDAAQPLPDKRQRNPIIYAVAHTDETGAMQITECDDKRELKRFINTLDNPAESVKKIYRVSATIELKQKTVVSI